MARTRTITFLASATALVLASLAVAGCGSSGGSKANSPAPPKTANGQSATVGVANENVGKILVDSQGRTLYLFEKDTGKKSMCSGACATLWPASTTSGHPKAGSKVDAALLGTSTRSDGTSQLTYNGHPLYRYAGDTAAGDTNGQDLTDFGGGWYVVSPAGQKIEGHGTTSTTSGGGNGY
jgi:predicted lipoprotein with Yx(FWY)xxD motif